jgi:hypothetical protein
MDKLHKLSSKFFSDGFAVEHSIEFEELVDKAIDLLLDVTSYHSNNSNNSNNSNKLELLENSLAEVFERDAEEYVGLLKGFANTPLVQSFATSKFVCDFVKRCGVYEPALVTNPILHVVSKRLIINREKVFTPSHQDVISTKGSVGQVVVWIPLHAIESDNYGILVNPKSHLLGILPVSYSGFGHTVMDNQLSALSPETYVEMNKGDVCMFSQYLVHRTHDVGKFRIAVSFRLNDLSDPDWRRRKFYVPFGRSVDDLDYPDKRDKPPSDPKAFFSRNASN